MEAPVKSINPADSLNNSVILRAWYVSEHRLPELLQTSQPELWERLNSSFDLHQRKIYLANLLGSPIISFIKSNCIPSLHTKITRNDLTLGSYFLFDGTLCSRGLSARDQTDHVTLTCRNGTLPEDYKLKLLFSKSGLVTTTAFSAMAGTKHLFALASIQHIQGKSIEGVPFIVGNLVQKSPNQIEMPLHLSIEVIPSDVDQFSVVDFNRPVSKKQLEQLKSVPERRIKEILCSLLSEVETPSDWGGEECDLFTNNLRLRGRPISAAFLLKGPAKFHEMTMTDCGKNGDQIVRLFNTQADLLVLQHCHKITSAVRTHVRNAAIARMSTSCRYMFLDGYSTLNILRHVGEVA